MQDISKDALETMKLINEKYIEKEKLKRVLNDMIATTKEEVVVDLEENYSKYWSGFINGIEAVLTVIHLIG